MMLQGFRDEQLRAAAAAFEPTSRALCRLAGNAIPAEFCLVVVRGLAICYPQLFRDTAPPPVAPAGRLAGCSARLPWSDNIAQRPPLRLAEGARRRCAGGGPRGLPRRDRATAGTPPRRGRQPSCPALPGLGSSDLNAGNTVEGQGPRPPAGPLSGSLRPWRATRAGCSASGARSSCTTPSR